MGWTGQAERVQRIARRTLGEPIEYRREGFAVLKFDAILIEASTNPLIFDGITGSGNMPVLEVNLGEMQGMHPQRDDEVMFVDRNTCYFVAEVHLDGEGEAALQLSKQKTV